MSIPNTSCQECIDGSHWVCKNTRICPCAKKGHPEQSGFQKIDLPRAIDVLKQIRDDPTTPMHTAADISQVLVMYLDDQDGDT